MLLKLVFVAEHGSCHLRLSRGYAAPVLRLLRPAVARPKHVTLGRERERPATGSTGSSLHHRRAARMKHRSSSEQHHGKRPRVPAVAASTSPPDRMEDKPPSNPRELTQNPLKKIWMPCKNGLPEKHISQRKSAYDDLASVNI